MLCTKHPRKYMVMFVLAVAVLRIVTIPIHLENLGDTMRRDGSMQTLDNHSPGCAQTLDNHSPINIDTPVTKSIFNGALQEAMRGKTVHMQVGSLGEGARAESTFWIEFDPQMPMRMDTTRLSLPFLAIPDQKDNVSFYIHEANGCSSTARCSMLVPSVAEYAVRSKAVCDAYSVKHGVEEGLIPFFGSIQGASRVSYFSELCFLCQNPSAQRAPVTMPAVQLGKVVQEVLALTEHGRLETLMLDAQGRDLELLLSLSENVTSSIARIVLECQYSLFLYDTAIVNHCDHARVYLERLNFAVSFNLNNCACDEYNLVAVNQQHRV